MDPSGSDERGLRARSRTDTDSGGFVVGSLAVGTPAALAADGAASTPPVDRAISIHGAADHERIRPTPWILLLT